MFIGVFKNGNDETVIMQDAVGKDFTVAVMIVETHTPEVTGKEQKHVPIAGIFMELFPDVTPEPFVLVTQCNFICTHIIAESCGHAHHKATSISFIKVTNVHTSQEPILTSSRPEIVIETSEREPHFVAFFFWHCLLGEGKEEEEDDDESVEWLGMSTTNGCKSMTGNKASDPSDSSPLGGADVTLRLR